MLPRILVTGGSGFIGRHVVAAVREARGDTPPPVRLVLRDPASLPPGGGPYDGTPPADVVRADLTDPTSLRGVCAGVDVVLHCASHIGDDERLTEAVNDHGTRALVEEATRAGVARFVYVSTAAVYGRGPFTGALPGELPLAPASPTSRARAAAERHVLDAGGVVLRPHLVLGAGDRWVVPGLVTLMGRLSAGLKDRTARHSVVDVRALGRAVVAAGLSERDLAGVHHVNHPDPVGSSELLDTVADRLGLRLPGAPLDIEEARTRLAGQPRALHHLGMLAVDHWFADGGFWAGAGVDPGAGFARELAEHAAWYRQFLDTPAR
ncbi:NAD-dependent epimerase/dehydratase family protein [Streptomyces viridochromogenes]|uniref:NAD-dependent epimerase/dehydratase family protein n=1 Tax=Streptomyces viridochromogenes TaxID=1938 RepID=UPI00069ED47C|nr:NAD-dependent epimerase/dehydratase family protein [Streptomyces viridochromogenes]KOG17099.1 NAD-dependent dehydratase [Streptomyces viridochromogenes]KOG20120.1 NAD-dependent dehydratase [Streptomyces viridochromogenes]